MPVEQRGQIGGEPGLRPRQDLAGVAQRDDAATVDEPVALALRQLVEVQREQRRPVVEPEQHRLVVGLRGALANLVGRGKAQQRRPVAVADEHSLLRRRKHTGTGIADQPRDHLRVHALVHRAVQRHARERRRVARVIGDRHRLAAMLR